MKLHFLPGGKRLWPKRQDGMNRTLRSAPESVGKENNVTTRSSDEDPRLFPENTSPAGKVAIMGNAMAGFTSHQKT